MDLDTLLLTLDYRPEDDSWETDGRRTWVCDEDADARFFKALGSSLRGIGWAPHGSRLRAFIHARTGETIEVEPGGADTSGHFLHLFKPGVMP